MLAGHGTCWPKIAVGWLDLIRVQLPPTSPLALSSSGGERERERAWYTHFIYLSTTPCEWSSAEVLWQVVKSVCFSIVYLLVIK